MQVPDEFVRYVVDKGSITIDGISLTVPSWRIAFPSSPLQLSPSSPIPTSTPTFATANPATPSTSKAMF